MIDIDFNIGDRVITSRGIYGTVISIDRNANTSQVNIGNKTYKQYNNKLWYIKNII